MALAPPVADKELARPDRHGCHGAETVLTLLHLGMAGFLSGAVIAGEFAAHGGEWLLVGKGVARVHWRVNRSVSTPPQIGAVPVRDDVHDMQFIPLGFSGAQLVADEVDQQPETRDVG